LALDIKKRKVSVSMKDSVFKRRALVLIIAGVVALLVVSLIVGSFVVYHLQHPTGATETSGCATPLAPRENMLYVLASQRTSQLKPQGISAQLTKPQGPLYISAVDTNGRQSWMQQFTTFSPGRDSNASLEVRNGIVYAFATAFVPQSNLNIVAANIAAAYNANSGKQLWGIQVPNASDNVQSPVSNAIVGMSICNNRMYLWTQDALSAYNAKNGSLLWQDKWLPLRPSQTGFNPHVEVTDTAIVFASWPTATSTQGTSSYENAINALNPKNGTLLWKVDFPKRNQSGQYVALSLTATDKAVYASQFNRGSPQKVDALSISNGKLLWNTFVNMNIANNFIRSASTIVGNNVLYSYTSNTGLVALNVNNGTHLWDESNVYQLQPSQDRLYVTHAKASDLCQLDPTTGKSQWCKFSIQTGYPIKAVSDQTTLYIAGTAGVSALQKDNGKISWVYKENTSRAALMETYGLSLDY